MTKAILDKNGFATQAGFITVYCYNHSGEYLGSHEEYVSLGVGIPAHSCLDAPPPSQSGFIAIRKKDGTNGYWQQLADHRGETIYNTQTRQKSTVSEPGEIDPQFTTLAPNSPFDSWDGQQWRADAQAQHHADINEAKRKQTQLLAEANELIIPLQDAIDLDIANEQEQTAFRQWRQYRVLLNRLDLNAAPNIQWPAKPIL